MWCTEFNSAFSWKGVPSGRSGWYVRNQFWSPVADFFFQGMVVWSALLWFLLTTVSQNELQDILPESQHLATLTALDFCSFKCHLDIWKSFSSYHISSTLRQAAFYISHTRGLFFFLCIGLQNTESCRVYFLIFFISCIKLSTAMLVLKVSGWFKRNFPELGGEWGKEISKWKNIGKGAVLFSLKYFNLIF